MVCHLGFGRLILHFILQTFAPYIYSLKKLMTTIYIFVCPFLAQRRVLNDVADYEHGLRLLGDARSGSAPAPLTPTLGKEKIFKIV